MNKRFVLYIFIFVIVSPCGESNAQIPITCAPGWNGQIIIDCESTLNWSIEHDDNSSGTLETVVGFIENAVQLNWNIYNGSWVQAKYTFLEPLDLSSYDIFGLSLHGDTSSIPNRVSIMFADTNNVFYGLDYDSINMIGRWMTNLPMPKKMFYHFFTIPPGTGQDINWSKIDRFFVVVKRPDSLSGGGDGEFIIDHLQADRAVDWPRQEDFDTVVVSDSSWADSAVSYVMSRQKNTGLFLSWKEEPEPKAHLYDQALVLILLSREGEWDDGLPLNEAAERADSLVKSVNSYQYSDGHWPRTWNPDTGDVLYDDEWVGDQAWWIMALRHYYETSKDTLALEFANRGAEWIIDSCGIIVPSTEGTVDIWWALMSTGHLDEANSVKGYLLSTVWDDSLKYWWRGYDDPFVAMDAATWVGEFAKTDRVGRSDMAKAALSFVRRTLITTDDSGSSCGFDGMGPVSIWCEGTAQFISAGGEDAQAFLDMLLLLQRSDGGMPGSTDNWSGTCFGWLSTWTGLAPTAWLYFALTRSPFDTTAFSTSIVNENRVNSPIKFISVQNYPNPFGASTRVSYTMRTSGFVKLKIYDILGREIRILVNEFQRAGEYSIEFDASNLSSGVYFYKLRLGSDPGKTRIMLLLR